MARSFPVMSFFLIKDRDLKGRGNCRSDLTWGLAVIGVGLSSTCLSFFAILGPAHFVTKMCCIKRASIQIDNNKLKMSAFLGFWIVKRGRGEDV